MRETYWFLLGCCDLSCSEKRITHLDISIRPISSPSQNHRFQSCPSSYAKVSIPPGTSNPGTKCFSSKSNHACNQCHSRPLKDDPSPLPIKTLRSNKKSKKNRRMNMSFASPAINQAKASSPFYAWISLSRNTKRRVTRRQIMSNLLSMQPIGPRRKISWLCGSDRIIQHTRYWRSEARAREVPGLKRS